MADCFKEDKASSGKKIVEKHKELGLIMTELAISSDYSSKKLHYCHRLLSINLILT